MQTPKSRSCSAEAHPKVSPQAARKLKPTALKFDTASSSNQASKTPKERSTQLVERKSPKSTVTEKKRPSRISELESRISLLKEDLDKAKEQLLISESYKIKAQQDAEKSKEQISDLSLKLEQSQKQLLEQSASEEARFVELQSLSHERDRLENEDLPILKANLEETLALVETMKTQLQNCEKSEAEAREMVTETLLQLETAKKTIKVLRSDGIKAMESYNSIAFELDESRARENLLEGLVNKIKAEHKIEENEKMRESNQIEDEFSSLKSEVERLKSALETAESRYYKQQIQSADKIKTAYDLVEQIKSGTSLRQAEQEKELEKLKADVEDLKAELMDKETELQGISEENEALYLKLEKNASNQKILELEKELNELKEQLADMKMEKEQKNVSELNERLKLENHKLEIDEMEAELRRLKVQSEQWRKAAEVAAAMVSVGNDGRFMDRSGSLDSNCNAVIGKISLPYGEEGDDDELVKRKNGNVLKKIGVLWKKQQR